MSYETLKADIAAWLARSDLTGVIPSFIALAEARHARDIRIQSMMRRARALGQDNQYLPLPKLYLEMRRLSIIDTSDNLSELTMVTPESFRVRSNGGEPRTYCVHREIEMDAPLDSTRSLEMVYYRAFDPLSMDNTTNWLLENAYDAYLYGSLVAAEPYLRNDERIAVWGEGYAAAVGSLAEQDRRGRVNRGGQQLSMVNAGTTP